jgi:hypothetical protein
MYVVDEQDVVTPLQGVPQSDTGAPLPLVLQDERRCLVAFLVSDAERNAERTIEARVALAEFAKPYATVFRAPNDEAFAGHPGFTWATPLRCFRGPAVLLDPRAGEDELRAPPTSSRAPSVAGNRPQRGLPESILLSW